LLFPTSIPEVYVDAALDTLAMALYARTEVVLKATSKQVPWRPPVGIDPGISDATVVKLAVPQDVLGYTSEARWLRFAGDHLRYLFPLRPPSNRAGTPPSGCAGWRARWTG
jgi:hypothetical protein